MLHSNKSETLSNIYTVKAKGMSIISRAKPNKTCMTQLKIMPQKAAQKMEKGKQRAMMKTVISVTEMNGCLNSNIKKTM